MSERAVRSLVNMDAKLLFGLTIFSACVANVWVIATVVTPPSNVTVKKGDKAEFQCDTSSPEEVVQWSKFLPRTEVISVSGRPFNSSGKYQVVNNSALIINNVNASDGLPYACLAVFEEVQPHYANLVVIDNFTAIVTPSDTVSSGDNVNLTCVLQYGGPTKDNSIYPLSPDQELHLSIFLGDEDLTQHAVVEQRSGSDLHPVHTKTLSVNRVVTLDDINKEVRCRVNSVRPFYEDFFNTTFPFKYSATRVMINGGDNETADMQFYAGTLLNCSADGIPAPRVTWQAVDRNPASEIVLSAPGFSVLRLMGVGLHQWNCTASNAVNGIAQAFQFRNFTVIGVPPNVVPSKTGSIGFGVGLGVGLGVLFLLGIVLIFVLRKKKYSGYKRPATNQKKSPIYNKSSPYFGTGGVPSPLPTTELPSSKVLPATSYNGLAINPSSAHETSRISEEASVVAPPKRRTSDNPGHGDLGVRTLGASGSMPRLNESFDSAAERNYTSNPNYAPMDTSYHSNQRVRNQPSMDMSYHIDPSAPNRPPVAKSRQNNHFYPKGPPSDAEEDEDLNTSV